MMHIQTLRKIAGFRLLHKAREIEYIAELLVKIHAKFGRFLSILEP